MSGATSTELDWKFSQSFGEGRAVAEDAQDGDLVSAIQFDRTGDHIAVGDKGGRIQVFEREEKKRSGDEKKKKTGEKKNLDYKLRVEFQSHEPEFDYLKSLEIEEKINKIQWLPPQNNAQFLLSTNGM
jgi:serine/threonine-protein phosphatase 2A regulatory subunit B